MKNAVGEIGIFLKDRFEIEVDDLGRVKFWSLDEGFGDVTTADVIFDLPILLYHYTSSARIPSIRKHGLEPDRRSVNGRATPAVYLTTETDGPAVRGYCIGR